MSEHDLYRAPEARIEAALPQERLAIEAAGRWRRFFNWVIDYATIRFFWTVVAGLYLAWHVSHGDTSALAVARYKALPTWCFFLYGLATIVAYYVLMEGLFGCTVGKLVTGTRVANAQGARPTWGQAFGRTLCRFIPFEPLSVLFSQDDAVRGWHDRVPDTRVVRRRR